MGTLVARRWTDAVGAGYTKWGLARVDKVHNLTLPNNAILRRLWKKAVPPGTPALRIRYRYPWGCIVHMPIGLPSKTRRKFVALVEGHKSTVVPESGAAK